MRLSSFTSQLCSAAIAAMLLASCSASTTEQKANTDRLNSQQAQVPLIPIEDFFNEQNIHHLKMSADGKWLAFTKEYQGASNIYVMADKSDLASATLLTQSIEPIKEFEWSSNSNELFFMKDKGGNDPRVTQVESDNIAKKMYQKSLPVEYLLAKDEGHGFIKRANKLAAIIATERFFGKYLGGKVDNNVNPALLEHLNSLNVDIEKL